MNMQIPAGFFYALGTMLIVFGVVRAYHFGWRLQERNIDEGLMPRTAGQKRHLLWGGIYVLMGIFLIVSTVRGQGRP